MAASTSHICAGETPALRSRSRFAIWAVCAIVVVAAAAYKVWSSRIVAHPMCVAQAVPESPRLVAGAWHWIERAGAQVHLVRVLGGKRTVIASHEDIVGYSASPTSVAWAARDGAKWQVQSGSPDGTGRRTVWESPNKLFAAWTDGTKTAWVVD
ncbi:MAG: hypothetical protein FJX72_13310, partial [Armatimonadetes bacterium]|nr:hypothetical protein [Armatimonadota bacterium]